MTTSSNIIMLNFLNNIISWGPNLLWGLGYTLLLTFVSFAISLILGLILAIPRISSENKAMWYFRIPASCIVELIRGTPLILQLFYVFYVFPYFGIKLSAVVAAILALSVNSGAYLSEVYRSGIDAISRTQYEASSTLGFNYLQTMRYIILPQAIRIVIPAIANYLIVMFKDSALASTISVSELLFTGKIIASNTFQYISIYTTVFIIYFLISYPAIISVRILENKWGK